MLVGNMNIICTNIPHQYNTLAGVESLSSIKLWKVLLSSWLIEVLEISLQKSALGKAWSEIFRHYCAQLASGDN